PPISSLFPYTTLFRSVRVVLRRRADLVKINLLVELQVFLGSFAGRRVARVVEAGAVAGPGHVAAAGGEDDARSHVVEFFPTGHIDRKSTRLNSSHVAI